MISKNLTRSHEEKSIHKISELITHIYSTLLPRTTNNIVYRNLSQQQQQLLSQIDSNLMIHSILAGCLAIDSCLQNIWEMQQSISGKIVNNFLVLLMNYNPIPDNNTQNNCSKVEQSLFLIYGCLLQLVSENSYAHLEQIKNILEKRNKIYQPNIRIDNIDIPHLPRDINNSSDIITLTEQNNKLKEQITSNQQYLKQLEATMKMLAEQNAQFRNTPQQNTKARQNRHYIVKLKQKIKQQEQIIYTLGQQLDHKQQQLCNNQQQLSYQFKEIIEELLAEINDIKHQNIQYKRSINLVRKQLGVVNFKRNNFRKEFRRENEGFIDSKGSKISRLSRESRGSNIKRSISNDRGSKDSLLSGNRKRINTEAVQRVQKGNKRKERLSLLQQQYQDHKNYPAQNNIYKIDDKGHRHRPSAFTSRNNPKISHYQRSQFLQRTNSDYFQEQSSNRDSLKYSPRYPEMSSRNQIIQKIDFFDDSFMPQKLSNISHPYNSHKQDKKKRRVKFEK